MKLKGSAGYIIFDGCRNAKRAVREIMRGKTLVLESDIMKEKKQDRKEDRKEKVFLRILLTNFFL